MDTSLNKSESSRSNLQGSVLRVVGVRSSVYAFDTKISVSVDGAINFEPSFAIEVLNNLQVVMNFTVIPILATTWGYINENTSEWDGMIATLLNQEADLAISSAADVPLRRQVVDFNIPTTSLKLAAFFKNPPSPVVDTLALLEPFGAQLWWAIAVFVIITTVGLACFNFIHEISYSDVDFDRRFAEDGSQHKWQKIADSFMWSLASVCCRGCDGHSDNLSSKCLILSSQLAGVVFYAAYSGTLISFLSVAHDGIETFDELLSSDFRIGLTSGNPFVGSYMQYSTLEVHRRIYSRSDPNVNYVDIEEAKDDMLAGSFAFIEPDMTAQVNLLESYSAEEICSLRQFYVPYSTPHLQGTMVPKNSPLRKVIDYQILRFQQFGLVYRWKKTYIPRPKNDCAMYVTHEGVRVDSFIVAFGILGGGVFLAFAVWILEKQCCLKKL